MPAVRTEKAQKQWKHKKRRSVGQLANCFGSNVAITAPAARTSSRGKENAPPRQSSSRIPAGPYTPSSPVSIGSDDALLAMKFRSDKYEKDCRNLTRKFSRAKDSKQELQRQVKDLETQLSGVESSSSAFVASLQRQLADLRAELACHKEAETALQERHFQLSRKKNSLSKRVARFPDRLETGVAKLSTQSLKESGIISADIRACVRDIVGIGAPLEGVSKIIHAVAKGLNIKIKDDISTRSAGRIVLEGGVAAHLQIVDAVKNVDHFTASGDGTSHKHLNYEARFITSNEKLLALGLAQAPNHTSEEQLAGWQKLIEEMYAEYNASPLGRAHPEDFRTFFIKITGLMTDHAADQKKLRALFEALKKRMDREVRGENVLLRLGAPELLDAIYEISKKKIDAAGGMAAWDALSADERDHRNSTLHAELCQIYGHEEFMKLSQAERDDVDFFLGGGCFMHKDLNAHLGGVKRMAASWSLNGFEPPVLLMNKDNDAAAKSGSVEAKARAEKVSSRGAVKFCELMGMLLNNKDDKKGQQDSHGVYFCAHEHIGYSIRFPDTSNTRYQCFSEASAEVIVNLIVYRQLLLFIRDRKMSLAFSHLEQNLWTAINNLQTLIELVILLWYGQNFSHPVMRLVRSRSSTGGLRNFWDMGPAIRSVIAHLRRVIADPDLICGPNLSHETATMDGQPWERPEAMYTAHALLPSLPMDQVRAALVAFLEGALEVWLRFGADLLDVNLTEAQKRKAMMPTTNDACEGWLGSNARVAKRRAPNATLEFINSKSQYKHNGTADFIAEKLDTHAGQKFLRQRAQAISGEGREKKRKTDQAEADTRTVDEHRTTKQKSDTKKATDLAAINKCVPIFDTVRFTDSSMLKDIHVPQIDLQLKWHRLRELEMDKKSDIGGISKLNKQQKADAVVAAIGRWMVRVEAGDVPLMGNQVAEPLKPDETAVEDEEEEEDAGYGERE